MKQVLQDLQNCCSVPSSPAKKMLMRAASTVVQQLCKSCRTCFMFYCMFYFTCDHSFKKSLASNNFQKFTFGVDQAYPGYNSGKIGWW